MINTLLLTLILSPLNIQVSKDLEIIPTKNNQELCLKAGDYALLKTLIETSQYDCKTEKDALKELFREELTRLQDTHKIKIKALNKQIDLKTALNLDLNKKHLKFKTYVYISVPILLITSIYLSKR